MPWVYLIAAGLFEVGFASTLKLTDGFTKLWPTLIFTVCIVLSFLLLNKAVKGSADRNGLCDLDGDRRCRHCHCWNPRL